MQNPIRQFRGRNAYHICPVPTNPIPKIDLLNIILSIERRLPKAQIDVRNLFWEVEVNKIWGQ
jgi:hypothetical protein